MHTIILNIKTVTVFAIFMISMFFHANANQTDNILGRWVMTEVVYDDGSVNQLETSNFVYIDANTITEVIKGHGSRQYPYTRQNNVLTLTADNEQITWQILSEATHRLEVATPIGKYKLTR